MKHFKESRSFRKYKPYKSTWEKIKEGLSRRRNNLNYNRVHASGTRLQYAGAKKPSWNGLRLFIKIFIILVILLLWFWYVAYSQYFRIKNITYYNLKDISKTEIENTIREQYLNNWSLIPQDSYFLISTKKIENIIMDKFLVDSVTVRRLFPDKLEIEINEKPGTLIYDNGTQYFLLDDEGNVIKILWEAEKGDRGMINLLAATDTLALIGVLQEPSSTAGLVHIPNYRKMKLMYNNYPLILDLRSTAIANKQKNVLSGKIISSLLSWQKDILKQGIGTPLYFLMSNPYNGVIVKTTNKWDILFDPTLETTSTVSAVKNILKENIPDKYIDARFEPKIFWK